MRTRSPPPVSKVVIWAPPWLLPVLLIFFLFLVLLGLGIWWLSRSEQLPTVWVQPNAQYLSSFRSLLQEFSTTSLLRRSREIYWPLTNSSIFETEFSRISYQVLTVQEESSIQGTRYQTRLRGSLTLERPTLVQFYLPNPKSAWSLARSGFLWIRQAEDTNIYSFRLSSQETGLAAPAPTTVLLLGVFDADENPLRLQGELEFEATLSAYADRERGEQINFPLDFPFFRENDDWDRYLMCRP
jgi:hypothetical protein